MSKKNPPNNNNDNPGLPGNDGKRKNKFARRGKPKTYKQVKDNAKKVRQKKAIVYLPAVIAGKGPYTDGEPERMSEYEIDYLDALLAVELEKLAIKGLSNDQIIAALGISRFTFYKKVKEEPYFTYILHKYRGKAVQNVEYSLYKNSVGFEYKEEQATATGMVVEVHKQRLPETAAQKFFLTNRASEQWKNKVEQTLQLGTDVSGMAVVLKRRED